jgi:hypothetical protein
MPHVVLDAETGELVGDARRATAQFVHTDLPDTTADLPDTTAGYPWTTAD